MRAAGAVLLGLIFLGSCGYVGPVVPPSPEIPATVTDLNAIQRGDQIVIHFSAPPRTIDNLAIKRFSTVDLRIGAASSPFDFEKWGATATTYEVEPPEVPDFKDPRPILISKEFPASGWVGKHIVVAVRTSEKRNGHLSAWSNRGVLDVVEPLQPPNVEATPTAEGYKLTWAQQRAGLHYEVLRKGPGDSSPDNVGTAEQASFVDTTSQWNTPYEYSVIARQGAAESFPSKPVPVNHPNTFPPSVPGGVTALATPNSIELSWGRAPETSLQGYYLYRSEGGNFDRLGELIALPTYSDHTVQHGKTYRYQISSVSQAGIESVRSPATEPVTYP